MSAPVRVSQEERTRAMRLRLMEATVELLVEKGFSGTTTTLVSERSRFDKHHSIRFQFSAGGQTATCSSATEVDYIERRGRASIAMMSFKDAMVLQSPEESDLMIATPASCMKSPTRLER